MQTIRLGEIMMQMDLLTEAQVDEILTHADHLILNSLGQWRRFRTRLESRGDRHFGLRVNPAHNEVDNPLYDPCAPWSRLGVPAAELAPEDLDGLTGLLATLDGVG